MGRKVKAAVETVDVRPIDRGDVTFDIEGLSPLIQGKFADEALEKMLLHQQGKDGGKVARVIEPEKEAKGHTHFCSDGSVGYPADAFTSAIVEAAMMMGMFKKDVSHITVMPHDGELVRIKYGSMKVRRDVVRLANGAPDIVHRPFFYDWSVPKLRVMYDMNRMPKDKLAILINRAGYDIGVGAWRPFVKNGKGRTGWHGRFAIKGTPRGSK